MTLMRSRRRPIGVAIDDHQLVARLPSTQPGNGEYWTHSLTPLPESGPWPELIAALSALRAHAPQKCDILHVALMPPLGRVRLMELPGIREEEAARVVRRDPSRFFPVRGEKLAVELEGRGWRRSSPFVTAAAPSRILDAVENAAAEAGWSLGGVVPAQLAWAALTDSIAPRDIVVRLDGPVELLRVSRGTLIGTRRLSSPPAEVGPEIANDAIVIESASMAAAGAADLAVRSLGPVLQSDAARAAVRRANRRRAIVRFTIAAALLVAAALLELVGIERERNHLAAERLRIHHLVTQSLATRESIAVATERLTALHAVGAAAPRWSTLIAALADELPADAYLVSLGADGDSLHLEGAAVRAAPVFDAMNAMPSVRGVRPDGPIRQEIRGNNATEHFALSALVSRGDPTAAWNLVPNGSAHGGRP